jgi:cysteinyl-tRNA synthetase
MHEWRDHDLLRRALDVFGLASLAEDEEAPGEVHELARQRQSARVERDFARADELRDEIEGAGWEVRDDPGGYRLVRKA